MAQKILQTVCMIALLLAAGTLALGATPATTPEAARPAPGTAAPATPPHAPAAPHEAKPRDLMQEELKLGPFIVTIVIFLMLFLVLSKTAWKPIMTGLKTRENAIRDSIEAAAKAKADAERTTRELEEKMAEVQRQSGAALQQAKNDAIKIADSIRAQAEADSIALKDRTVREIDAAKQQALSEINNHAAELGTAVARKILQRQITVDDQQRLVDESLAELAKKN